MRVKSTVFLLETPIASTDCIFTRFCVNMSADEAKKPCFKAGRWNFTSLFIAASVVGTLLVAGAIAMFVLSSPKQLILWDIEQKLKPSEPPSGGSSYTKGGCDTYTSI